MMPSSTAATATFTPTSNVEDSTNLISILGGAVNDAAGNANVAGKAAANYAIDTKAPTVSSVTLSDSKLSVGETSGVTVVFSEAVSGLTSSDFVVDSGSISAVASTNNVT